MPGTGLIYTSKNKISLSDIAAKKSTTADKTSSDFKHAQTKALLEVPKIRSHAPVAMKDAKSLAKMIQSLATKGYVWQVDDFRANTTTGHIIGQLRLTYPLSPTKDQLAEAKKALRASMLNNAWSLNAETVQSRSGSGKGSGAGSGSGSGSGIGFDIKSLPFPHLIGAKKVSKDFSKFLAVRKPHFAATNFQLGAIEKLISDESKVSTLKTAIAIAERDKGIGAGALSSKREEKFRYEWEQAYQRMAGWIFIGPKDAAVRELYKAQIKKARRYVKAQIRSGKLTLIQAETLVHKLRGTALTEMRAISTSVGQALAEDLKDKNTEKQRLRQRKIDDARKAGRPFSASDF